MSQSDEDRFHELTYYTLAHPDPGYFIHQHVVDAHGAQTADENTKPIGLTFALLGLYLYVERGCSGKTVQRAHMQLGNQRRREWPRFALPEDRGALRVGDVLAAPPGPARDEAIRAWCEAVWAAYHESHAVIAELVRAELPELAGNR